MQIQAGVVKSIEGKVVAVDSSGAKRELNVGDVVYLGESIVGQDTSSKIVISANDGKDIVMLGKDTLILDQSVSVSEGFGNEAMMADVEALQQALLNGTDLQDLEATAAGGGDGSDGVSLGQVAFTQGGHISNVIAAYGDLGVASQSPQSSNVFAGAAVSGAAENVNSQQSQPQGPSNSGGSAGSGGSGGLGGSGGGLGGGGSNQPGNPGGSGGGSNGGSGGGSGGSNGGSGGGSGGGSNGGSGGSGGGSGGSGGGSGGSGGGSNQPGNPGGSGGGSNGGSGGGSGGSNGGSGGSGGGSNGGSGGSNGGSGGSGGGGSNQPGASGPSAPKVTFPEDADNSGTLSPKENQTDGDSGSTTARITIPDDAKPGDTLKTTVTGPDGKTTTTETLLTPEIINKGSVDIKVPVQDGKTSSVSSTIKDQSGNESAPGKGSIDVDASGPSAPAIMEIPSSAYNAELGQSIYEGHLSGKNNLSTPKDSNPLDHSNSYFKNLDAAQNNTGSTTPPSSEVQNIRSGLSDAFKNALPDGMVEGGKIKNLKSQNKTVGNELFYKEYVNHDPEKFDYQDGWFVSKDKKTIIGSDKAKKLVVAGENTDTSGYENKADTTVVKVKDNVKPKIFGSDKADDITVDGAKVGMISTGTGDDKITVKNGGEISTNINSGSGNDTINVDGEGTKVNGEVVKDEHGNDVKRGGILAGDGDDTINVTNKAEVKSGIYDGDGNDKINVKGGATVGDKDSAEAQQQMHAGIQLGDGKNTVTVEGADTSVSRITGYKFGEDKNGVKAETNNDVTVKDKATVAFDIDIDNRNVDKVTVDNATVKGTIFTNGGDDEINVNKSKVGGVLGEGGNDTININDSTIGGEGSFYGDVRNKATGKFDLTGSDKHNRSAYQGVNGDQHTESVEKHWQHGDDKINITNSTVEGKVWGGRGNDDINITDSTVKKGVYGDAENKPNGKDGSVDGNDTINVSGSTIEGIINGEGGDDKITVDKSKVAGQSAKNSKGQTIREAIMGEKGNDEISVQNKSNVDGNISGDQGDNKINVDGGSKVAGWVYGANAKDTNMYNETGNNTITVAGENTEVSRVGDVSSGDSKITISDKATVKSVHGDKGTDTITVDNATVTEKIEGGHGDDIINIKNGAKVKEVKGDLDNDTIKVADKNTHVEKVDGDKGDDTLIVENGAKVDNTVLDVGNDTKMTTTNNNGNLTINSLDKGDTIDLSKIAKVTENINSVDASAVNNAVVNVDPKDVLDLGSENKTLEIKGGSDDTVKSKSSGQWNADGSDATHKSFTGSASDNSGVTQTVTIKVENEVTTDL